MNHYGPLSRQDSPMVDEMFDGAQMEIADSEDSACASMSGGVSNAATAAAGAGPAASLMSELVNSDRIVHAEFYNRFGDLFNDQDLN